MSDIAEATSRAPHDAQPPPDDVRPAGDRYFRHPGDAVRLVLWALVSLLLVLFVELATATNDGVSTDLGDAASHLPTAARELLLACAQVFAILVPLAIVVALLVRRRYRRLGMVVLAATTGALFGFAFDEWLDLSGRVTGAVRNGTWIASPAFPSLVYVAGAAAVVAVGKPWLNRAWRRAADWALASSVLVLAIAGTAGVAALLLEIAIGTAAGAALLVAIGAPNRRPSPSAVTAALCDVGVAVVAVTLHRATGGRAQLYTALLENGDRTFVKVYARDSRDADLLYRGYRTLMLRGPNDDWPAASLARDVEHEALLLVFAQRAGVRVPAVEAVTELPDGAVALAVEYVDGSPLDERSAGEIDDALLDGVWHEVAVLHGERIAHRALRAANILVADDQPTIIDLGFGAESATPRQLAIDRAELLVSLATVTGPDRVVRSAQRVLGADALAAAIPYLQPLALSRATRRAASKGQIRELRDAIVSTTGIEPEPLEQLVRVRPRTLVMIAALSAAFYVLLPQLADVGDSVDAIGSANWWWLLACLVMSFGTYVAAAIALAGGVPGHLAFIPTVGAQLGSSFVNRVTPANVGGMALNVRFLQKSGVDPAQAVTGIGLNVAAGAVVHVVLLFVFLAWAGKSNEQAFQIPSTSKILIVIAVVLALVGVAALTRWGRKLLRSHVWRFLTSSWSSIVTLARSPAKMAALLGGSTLVTLCYIAALGCAVAAFDVGVSFAEVGAVYLGASIIAAAAPTPGGLGAMEAALVAGLTGVGVESGVAVAAVLSYRLLTYWIPILPGWLSFQLLERHELI